MGNAGERRFRGVLADSGTVNGVPLRSRLAVYGGGTYLGLTREVREAAGVDLADELEIVLRYDDEPRSVELPSELEAALARADEARARFDRLAFTHRREYAQWVGEAKRAETRVARAESAVAMLREGIKHP
jgi:8-oxo-dGTP pyrophosphatase MutT (NUDIX family)